VLSLVTLPLRGLGPRGGEGLGRRDASGGGVFRAQSVEADEISRRILVKVRAPILSFKDWWASRALVKNPHLAPGPPQGPSADENERQVRAGAEGAFWPGKAGPTPLGGVQRVILGTNIHSPVKESQGMHDVLRTRLLRKIESLPEEQVYQVLDYIEFLESKYARDLAAEASGLQSFAEKLEDQLRRRTVSPSSLREAFQLISAADRVLSNISNVGKELLGELNGSGEGKASKASPRISGVQPKKKESGDSSGSADGRDSGRSSSE
jgi:hypothetical protein